MKRRTAFTTLVGEMPNTLAGSFDPLTHKTISDLRYLAQHEMDLDEEQEIRLRHTQRRAVMAFRDKCDAAMKVLPNPPTTAAILQLHDAFPATDSFGKYHESLEMLRGSKASGIYAIIAERNGQPTGEVLYVGESHTDRLYDTITRHFRKWKINPRRDDKSRTSGGVTYNRAKVFVAWAILPADQAQDAQYTEIQRLKPRDNSIDGTATVSVE